jgi:hypothetical protein
MFLKGKTLLFLSIIFHFGEIVTQYTVGFSFEKDFKTKLLCGSFMVRLSFCEQFFD